MNVILISLDSVRADRLSCYGYEEPLTPNLDRLAATGIVFEQAFCHQPGTWLSHASLLKGSYRFRIPWDDQYHWNMVTDTGMVYSVVDDDEPTLPGVLQTHGYRTAGFVSAFNLDSHWGFGRDFSTYNDIGARARTDLLSRSIRKALNVPPYREADKTCDLARSWIDEHRGDPFFMFVHFMDAHVPYRSHAGLPGVSAYEQEIAFVDLQVGRLLDQLDECGVADDTMVVVVADHGESLGERSLPKGHGKDLYEENIHVPLLMRIPGVERQGTRYPGVARLSDVMPSILDYVSASIPETVTGVSLRAAIDGHDVGLDCFCFSRGDVFSASKCPGMFPPDGAPPMLCLRTADWKLIRLSAGDKSYEELYNLSDDPGETTDLTSAAPEKTRELRKRLIELFESARGSAATQDLEIDEAIAQRLRDLGYMS